MFFPLRTVVRIPNPFLCYQIEAEANAVRVVVEKLCPLNIVLDRVVLTSTGVLLGCWQVPSLTCILYSNFKTFLLQLHFFLCASCVGLKRT